MGIALSLLHSQGEGFAPLRHQWLLQTPYWLLA